MHELNLAMLLVCIFLLRVKTPAGGSIWNPIEQCMSTLNNTLCSEALCRLTTETDLEQKPSKMKSTNDLMNSNPPEKTKKLMWNQ